MKFSCRLFLTAQICLYSLVSSFSLAQKVEAPKFGKGIFNIVGKDSTWSMIVSSRMQFLGIAEWSEFDGEYSKQPQTTILLRRARLKLKGFAYDPKLTYVLQLGFSNSDISEASLYTSNSPRYVIDAYLRWAFYKNFSIQIGQAKLPGNIERLISSGKQEFVDRSIMNSKFNIDRDIGIQLRHKFSLTKNFKIKEVFSIAQGEGRNVTTGNIGGYQYTSRVELYPFGYFTNGGHESGGDFVREQKPKLILGIVYDFNKQAVKTRSNQGSYMLIKKGFFKTDISTLFLDSHFKYKGFSLLAEYVNRSSDNIIAKETDGNMTGDIVNVGSASNFQIGYIFFSKMGTSLRYSSIKLNDLVTNNSCRNQFTFALSKYISKHKLKVQADITFENSIYSNNKVFSRVQVDFKL